MPMPGAKPKFAGTGPTNYKDWLEMQKRGWVKRGPRVVKGH